MHGATFVVDAAFIAENLDNNGCDRYRPRTYTQAVLMPLNYTISTTCPNSRVATPQFLSKHIFDGLASGRR
jgi:hypothetical protein